MNLINVSIHWSVQDYLEYVFRKLSIWKFGYTLYSRRELKIYFLICMYMCVCLPLRFCVALRALDILSDEVLVELSAAYRRMVSHPPNVCLLFVFWLRFFPSIK